MAVRYEGTFLAGAIGKLGLFSSTFSLGTTQLQQAAAATQQWNQLILGLVIGWNSCVISKAQYSEGILQIYPRLEEDAQEFNQIAARLSRGQSIDESRLWVLLTSYTGKIRKLAKLAELSGNGAYEVLLQTKTNTDEILIELREMRKPCGGYQFPAPSTNYPSGPATVGISFHEQISDSLAVSDSVRATLSGIGPTSPLVGTIAGGPPSLLVSGGSLGENLPSDKSAGILLTWVSSQTTFSSVQLDHGDAASSLALYGGRNMSRSSVFGGNSDASLSPPVQDAGLLVTSMSSQTTLSSIPLAYGGADSLLALYGSGNMPGLSALGGSLGASLSFSNQKASILLTSTSSQTTFSGIQLDHGGADSVLALYGGGKLPALSVFAGSSGTSLPPPSEGAFLSPMSSQATLSGVQSETIIGIPSGVVSALTTLGANSADSNSQTVGWQDVVTTVPPPFPQRWAGVGPNPPFSITPRWKCEPIDGSHLPSLIVTQQEH